MIVNNEKTTTFISFFVVFASYGQTVFSFKEKSKDSLDHIESKYISAIDTREGFVCAFPKEEEEVLKHWTALHQNVQEYLKANKFEFQSDTRMFLRFYFSNQGNIEHIGYNLPATLTPEEVQKFLHHLTTFSQNYNFGMHADKAYVQCGTVTYKKSTLTE